MIITGDLNFSDPVTQFQVEELTQKLENTSYTTSPLYTESWLRTFLSYVERNNDYLNVTIDDEQSFIDNLKDIWLFPGNPFSLDVKYNEEGTRIIASRFLIQAFNITDTNHEKVMVKDLRDICKNSPLNATVFHPYFVFFDQFELVRPTAIQSMVIGALIMMLISFIFIPNFLCSLWVAFSIISIELGVAGYMSLWDVNLDSISMINLIMCIGFSVDFTAHICYTYMSSKAKTPDEKVREALYSLGLPILQGSCSTILGVIALLLAESYIFLVFFKMVFLVIFFGAMHGLFLLPVLLSLFGPGSYDAWCGKKKNKELKLSSIEKAFPHPYCIPHPQLALTGPFGNKTFLGAPYKAYGTDEKDLGIGTSGEDSSESSSSKSQRRQALEDENTRRRYEEGWRRSGHNNNVSTTTKQSTISTSASSPATLQKQTFQPIIDVYGHESEKMWTPNRSRGYDDTYLPPKRYDMDFWDDGSAQGNHRRNSDDKRNGANYIQKRFMDDILPDTPQNGSGSRAFQELALQKYPPVYEPARRYSDENRRRFSDERRPRRYTPPEGIYRQNPNRSNSQHNLYYPRIQPQRSSSQHSLRHMGDMRFP